MARATWKGATLAESEQVETVEGNLYFPPDSLDLGYFTDSDTQSTCPWKGVASYYHVVVDGETNQDAAWTYREPKPEAASIRDHVAFWRGVEIEK